MIRSSSAAGSSHRSAPSPSPIPSLMPPSIAGDEVRASGEYTLNGGSDADSPTSLSVSIFESLAINQKTMDKFSPSDATLDNNDSSSAPVSLQAPDADHISSASSGNSESATVAADLVHEEPSEDQTSLGSDGQGTGEYICDDGDVNIVDQAVEASVDEPRTLKVDGDAATLSNVTSLPMSLLNPMSPLPFKPNPQPPHYHYHLQLHLHLRL
ncbi:hypothetical protein BC829DRAFT_22157 [Chytridium lagenaria]|nr:hypothetical protein BC829DRAFT_22157 [Chytridium lagenaria]